MEKKKIVALVGPTATGKTALSVELAKRFDGEIICMDSMQIYKEMNIGTAKPTVEEMSGVKHHLFDFVSPFTPFSCKEYVDTARGVVEDILSRGKLPIFCGGTGLYIDRFVNGGNFEETRTDENYRREMEKYAEENGNTALHKLLEEVDKESADAIHENNVKRVIRALEIYKTTGRKKSDIDKESKIFEPEYDLLQIGLCYNDKNELYSRIEKRVDGMIEEGLLEETEKLYQMGVFERNNTSAQAIGYKELLTYIKGETSFEDAITELKTATRKYAKRQMTWFNSHGDTKWINKDNQSRIKVLEIAGKYIEDFLNERN